MFTLLRRQPRPSTPAAAPLACTIPTPHRDRFGIEVVFYHTPADLADCLHTPRVGGGKLVVVFAARGEGRLPPALAALPDRLIHTTDVAVAGTDLLTGWFEPDPKRAVVAAMSGLRTGDTLLLLLPADWDGPAAEELIDHARRWFASPHSREDELRVG